MIEIIEHKDYNKPVDNETVVEVDTVKNQKKKLFKVFDGIWLDPEATIITEEPTSNPFVLAPYQNDYCKTIEQKSKYLEQMTILFKRINSTPLGQGILTELHKGSPIDFSKRYVWNISNMVAPRTSDDTINRKLRATCIIKPSTGYLGNSAMTQSVFKAGKINTIKLLIHFNPDCIYSFNKNNLINYIDPDIVLYHELLHIVHSTYGILGTKVLEEEFITFGHNDARPYLNKEEKYYKNTKNTLLENLNLIKIHVDTIFDPIDKKYFKEKYGFINTSVVDDNFVDNYIKRYQYLHSEYNYIQQLHLNHFYRTSYKDKLFLVFHFDISDNKIYNIENGLTKVSDYIETIKHDPSNILTGINIKLLHKYILSIL